MLTRRVAPASKHGPKALRGMPFFETLAALAPQDEVCAYNVPDLFSRGTK